MFYLLESLKGKVNKFYFDRVCRRIRYTRPVEYLFRDDVRILSQVHHDALDMYLLAIKSFLFNFTIGSVYVLNDGSLTDEDIRTLEYHIPKITIRHIKEIDVSGFPAGNTWERLLYYVDLSKDAYVIQLDTDIIAVKPLLDLHQLINENRGFIIGNGPAWDSAIDVDYLSRLVSNWITYSKVSHVQIVSEATFHLLDAFDDTRSYFRGCSAFTGLPRGQVDRQQLLHFSQQVVSKIGEIKWSEWGSEQVSCCVMTSSSKDPKILPWLSYQNYGFPSLYKANLVAVSLIHFIGTFRYTDGTYRRYAKQFIELYENQTGLSSV